jgi:hypothetical protein
VKNLCHQTKDTIHHSALEDEKKKEDSKRTNQERTKIVILNKPHRTSIFEMQLSYTTFAAAVLALGNTALAAVTGPFYITIVPEDGSASYPSTVATVSRGAQILSSALDYEQEFTFNT